MAIALFSDTASADNDDSDDDLIVLDAKGKAPARGPAVGWIYVGSHNFTPSAWGTLSGSGFTPILNVRLVYY